MLTLFYQQGNGNRVLIAACLFSLALVLTGCIASDPDEVVILCALDREFSEAILDDVSAELKIPLRKKFDIESNKTVGLANEIMLGAQRPRADLFWNNEVLHSVRLERMGLLQRYDSPEAARFPSQFVSRGRCWFGFAGRCRVLIVNTDLMPNVQDRPTSVKDLADPRYKQRCTLARPLFGTSATHAAVLYDTIGWDVADEFFCRVAENCVMQGGNKQVAQRVAAGEFMFGLTDTDDAITEIEKGRPVALVFPDQGAGGTGALLIPNTICLIKNGPNTEAAKRVIDRLLKTDVEMRLNDGPSAQFPLGRDGTAVARLLESNHGKKDGRLTAPLKRMQVDFESAAQQWPKTVGRLLEIFPVGGR